MRFLLFLCILLAPLVARAQELTVFPSHIRVISESHCFHPESVLSLQSVSSQISGSL